jgi:hypothetical protein
MIEIAMNHRWRQRDLRNLQMFLSGRNIAELDSGVSKVENVTTVSNGRPTNPKGCSPQKIHFQKNGEYKNEVYNTKRNP